MSMLEKLIELYNLVMLHLPLVLAVLLGISEALALVPQIKANSIFQAILNGLKFIKEKFLPKKAA
jgi:hypothetical protein